MRSNVDRGSFLFCHRGGGGENCEDEDDDGDDDGDEDEDEDEDSWHSIIDAKR